MIQGKRIYYDKTNGQVILLTPEMFGEFIPLTTDQEINVYSELSSRSRDSFGILQLEPKQYETEFSMSCSLQVNTVTHEILFSYPDPYAPEESTPYVKPLSDRVDDLEQAINFMLMGGM